MASLKENGYSSTFTQCRCNPQFESSIITTFKTTLNAPFPSRLNEYQVVNWYSAMEMLRFNFFVKILFLFLNLKKKKNSFLYMNSVLNKKNNNNKKFMDEIHM